MMNINSRKPRRIAVTLLVLLVLLALVGVIVGILVHRSDSDAATVDVEGVSLPGATVYQSPSVTGLSDLTLGQDGSVVAVGTSGVYGWGAKPRNWSSSSLLMKIGADGNASAKIYKTTGSTVLNSIAMKSDGSLVVVGMTTDSDSSSENGYVALIDKNESLVWQRVYTDSGYIRFESVELVADGSMLVTGQDRISKQDQLIKMSETGEIEWVKSLDLQGIRKVSITSDSNIVVLGYLPGSPSQQCKSDTSCDVLMELSSVGDVLWSVNLWTLNDLLPQRISNTILVLDNTVDSEGNIYLVGSDLALAYAAKFDSSGKLIWSKSYECEQNGARAVGDFQHASIAPGGGIAVTGYVIARQDGVPGSHHSVLIARIDNAGEMQWQQVYDDGSNNDPNGIVALADGSITVVGNWHLGIQDPVAGFVVRLTADGALG